jgi:hypothetical protein
MLTSLIASVEATLREGGARALPLLLGAPIAHGSRWQTQALSILRLMRWTQSPEGQQKPRTWPQRRPPRDADGDALNEEAAEVCANYASRMLIAHYAARQAS